MEENPDPRKTPTALIAARSWSTPEMALVLGAFLLLYLAASFICPLFPEEQMPVVQLVATLLIYSIATGVVVRINRERNRSWESGYGMGLRQTKALLSAPLLYLVLILPLALATAAWHRLLEQAFGMEIELQEALQVIALGSSWLRLLYILMAVVAAPLFEELVFRGLLFPYLVKRAGLAGGTVVVSALFALMHRHTPAFVPLFLLSAALCLAYWRAGSLWISIGTHAIFNAVAIALALHLSGQA